MDLQEHLDKRLEMRGSDVFANGIDHHAQTFNSFELGSLAVILTCIFQNIHDHRKCIAQILGEVVIDSENDIRDCGKHFLPHVWIR